MINMSVKGTRAGWNFEIEGWIQYQNILVTFLVENKRGNPAAVKETYVARSCFYPYEMHLLIDILNQIMYIHLLKSIQCLYLKEDLII